MKINLESMKQPPFINRESELNTLLEYSEKGYYPILYLYGPEGCGKTRLLLELVKYIQNRKGYIVTYIDVQSVSDIKSALIAPSDITKVIIDLIKDISGPIGKILAYTFTRLAQNLSREKVENKRIVVLIDDVARPLGLEIIETYAKNLLNLLEELYSLNAKSVFILATTSEGLSRKLLARHNYVRLRELWNLSLEAAQELLKVLKSPSFIRNDMWLLTGGNPRSIVELWRKNWSIKMWLDEIKFSIKPLIEDLMKKFKIDLKRIIKNIDEVLEYPTLREKLINANLIVPIDRPCLGYTPPINEKLGIGEYYAWQIPAYRVVLERLIL